MMAKLNTVKQMTFKASLLGPFIVDDLYRVNCYLYQANQTHILIDITPFEQTQDLIEAIKTYVEIKDLTHLVLLTPHLTTYDAIKSLMSAGFNGKIITNRYFKRQLKLSLDIETIETLKYRLDIDNTKLLTFIPTSFLPHPEMFLVYAHESQSLFSGTLCSSFHQKMPFKDDYDRLKTAQRFHQALIPNSEFVKTALKSIEKYDIEAIYPAYGYQIKPELLDEFMLYISKLDFYNNYVVYLFKADEEKEINFIEALNHMLLRLESYFSRIEILNVFVGSPFTIDAEHLSLKRTHLLGYKMWHQFFEHIYTKKGMPWLLILEPIVFKYHDSQSIELPNIYRSLILDLEKQKDQDALIKHQYEVDLSKLEQQKKEILDQMLRCPITHLYLENVLRETLKVDLMHRTKDDFFGFALIQLDQLNEINRRYGKDAGDEAIRSMAYQLGQIRQDETHIYKQKGPGLIVYINHSTKDVLQACALKARNTINDSDVFIEKLSASIATVSSDEMDDEQSVEEQIDQIFSLLERRMWFARIQGKGVIIDDSYELPKSNEGSILLIDEDPISRNMLNRIFLRLDFVVKLATSANEAFDIIKQGQIDLIISEINLSKIDGFQLKQMLNETKAYKEIPFIMVSHNKTLDNIKRGNTLDVDLILEKPIIPDELIGHVKRLKERVVMS